MGTICSVGRAEAVLETAEGIKLDVCTELELDSELTLESEELEELEVDKSDVCEVGTLILDDSLPVLVATL